MAGKLLSAPLDMDKASLSSEAKFPRIQSESENLSRNFRLPKRDFQRQFFHIYALRLETLRERVKKAAKSQLGDKVRVESLCNLDTVDKGQEVVVIGTLYKHQSLKPNILKDLSEDNSLVPQPPASKYISDGDELILEDENQRIKCRGNIDKDKLATGIVCGLYGREKESGKFHVKEIIYPEAPIQAPVPKLDADRYYFLNNNS